MFQLCEVSSFAYEISYDEKSAKKSAKFSTDVKLISVAKAPVKERIYLGDTNFKYYLMQERSNMLVTISLTIQLQVFIVEVLCLRSQLEDVLCSGTFSNKYIYPRELSPIATAKIGASWKTPVCPSTLAHPARKDYGSVN